MLCSLDRKNGSSNLMLISAIVNCIHKMIMVAFIIDQHFDINYYYLRALILINYSKCKIVVLSHA